MLFACNDSSCCVLDDLVLASGLRVFARSDTTSMSGMLTDVTDGQCDCSLLLLMSTDLICFARKRRQGKSQQVGREATTATTSIDMM